MREILFKALKDDMSNCIWVYGQLVYDAIGQPRITEVDSSGKGLTFHTCLKGTECQFTGLLDKNGNKIFEGDVIHFSSEKMLNEVVFKDGQFMARQIGTKGSMIGLGYCDWTKHALVTSNIHDK